MASRVNTEVYRASHGKRPGGFGQWIIDASYCSKHSMYQLSYLRTTDGKAVSQVEKINEHTYRVTFKSGTYSDAVSLLRRLLKHDRSAEIIPQP